MVITKEETFGHRPALPLQERRRGGQDGKRHRVQPHRLFLQQRIGLIWRVAESLEYGVVGINEGIISPKGPPARSPPSAA
jgi:succinate-semialdehyde dehydrogenase / glutarate-semialdehyde dehydrogenase